MIDPMQYNIPITQASTDRFKTIANALTLAYRALLENCPRGSERTLAIRKLQEARMWANASIVFEGQPYEL